MCNEIEFGNFGFVSLNNGNNVVDATPKCCSMKGDMQLIRQ